MAVPDMRLMLLKSQRMQRAPGKKKKKKGGRNAVRTQ